MASRSGGRPAWHVAPDQIRPHRVSSDHPRAAQSRRAGQSDLDVLVALGAARQLLLLHPEAGGFHLAPGAHASLPLDIMSEQQGLVGAETFAAVSPRNNGKLEKDLDKLKGRAERHRYVFFLSPEFPGNERRRDLERDGIQVWSVDV